MKANRITNPQNDYDHLVNYRDGERFIPYGLRIWCSSCTHNQILPLPAGNHHTIQQGFADRMFRNKGWELGRNRKHDTCPECQRMTREGRVKMKAVMPENVIAMVKPVVETPKAEQPPTMARDDRRIILSKLQEVYVDEKTGYDNGWSDKRVSTDLGVPQAWVAQLRDENFGPENTNTEARMLVAKWRELNTDMQQLRELAAKYSALHSEITTKFEQLNKEVARIQKQF